MEREFSYRDEIHTIKFEADGEDLPKADGFKASVGDNHYKFNVTRISDNCLSIILNDKTHTIYAVESDNEVFIHLDGRAIRLVKVGNDQKKFAREGLEFGVRDEIATPMPGKVVKILVNEGEQVKAGQSLVIVESMKMENEIKSPANGAVKSIHFKAGDLVEPGQPIIKLEPEE
jgi:biotin carboxyl carrier protein